MSNAIDLIRRISNPPSVVITRLPSHQLITLKTYVNTGDDGHVLTIYEDPSRYTSPLKLLAYKIGLRESGQIRPYMTEAVSDFCETHCKLCPHNYPLQTGAEPCRMRLGEWREAFMAVTRMVPEETDPLAFVADTDVIEPTPERRVREQHVCLAGHPDPSPPDPENHVRNPPLVWVPPQPVVLTIKMRQEECWKYDTANFSVGHLVKFNGAWHVGPRQLHLNTFNYGRVCWGQGNQAPPLVSFFDTFHAAIFNLDLTNDFDGWLRECERYQRLCNELPATERYFKRIDEASIISTDNQVKALMTLPSTWNESGNFAEAGLSLAASGVPVTRGTNPVLPLMSYTIKAGDAQIPGLITPIIPAINKCWFIQPSVGDSRFGKLLGQIDPPEDL